MKQSGSFLTLYLFLSLHVSRLVQVLTMANDVSFQMMLCCFTSSVCWVLCLGFLLILLCLALKEPALTCSISIRVHQGCCLWVVALPVSLPGCDYCILFIFVYFSPHAVPHISYRLDKHILFELAYLPCSRTLGLPAQDPWSAMPLVGKGQMVNMFSVGGHTVSAVVPLPAWCRSRYWKINEWTWPDLARGRPGQP